MHSDSTLFESAGILLLTIAKDNSLAWSGYTVEIKKIFESLPDTLGELYRALPVRSKNALQQAVENRKENPTCVLEFLPSKKNSTTLLAIVRVNSLHDLIQCSIQIIPRELLSNVCRETARTHEAMEVAEAHHRVKNTLQNIISYTHMIFARKKIVTQDEINKLIQYIHSLNTLHDLLFEEAKKSGDMKSVRIDRIIEQLLEIHSLTKTITCIEMPPIVGTPRRAATLSLIINEVLDYASSITNRDIQLEISHVGDHQARFILSFESQNGATQEQILRERPYGVMVAESVAKADLESGLTWSVTGTVIRVQFQLPLENGAH